MTGRRALDTPRLRDTRRGAIVDGLVIALVASVVTTLALWLIVPRLPVQVVRIGTPGPTVTVTVAPSPSPTATATASAKPTSTRSAK